MPRRNRRAPGDPEPLGFTGVTSPLPSPPGWTVNRYKGGPAGKSYVCPRCTRTVGSASDHVVAWREDDPHRHWHTECWKSAVREGIDRYRF